MRLTVNGCRRIVKGGARSSIQVPAPPHSLPSSAVLSPRFASIVVADVVAVVVVVVAVVIGGSNFGVRP